ncbi:MAG: peptide-methionine (S)-S-oxide reductase [Gammaproteobacteria bacterium]|nr:MAG: peptide-methionine (S)-S-oxide reductase [Gammaproteobacteria bacterium]
MSKTGLPSPEEALPGRTATMRVPEEHHVNRNPLQGPFPEHLEKAVFAMGCFWGVERLFWQQEGVYTTAAGYAGGLTANPSYEDVCSGMTGHTEVVLVVYDPAVINYGDLLKLFWEAHDPTQGMRQGMDTGTQYRSAIYCYGEDQLKQALETREKYQAALKENNYPDVTTEIREAPEFYYAEYYHQQYLAKEPNGYCSMRGTGVSCV